VKKKLFHITIDEPCAESWQNMLPNADGKFCMHCNKTVVDFTQQTSYEIKSYFQQNKENTCGRFTNQQLKETYTIYEASKFDHYKFVASLALGLLTLDTLNAFSIDGKDFKIEKDSLQIVKMIQQNQSDTEVVISQFKHLTGKTISLQNDSVILKGTVRDSANNEPQVGVNIFINNTTIGTTSDFDGNFELKVENNFPLDLTFRYIGYNDVLKTIYNPNEKIEVQLSDVVLDNLEQVIVTAGGARRIDSFSKKEARKYKRKHKQ
jgi:hypothetical protein